MLAGSVCPVFERWAPLEVSNVPISCMQTRLRSILSSHVQASVVVELVRGLLAAAPGLLPTDIGVMAPFRKQARAYRWPSLFARFPRICFTKQFKLLGHPFVPCLVFS